MKIVITGASGFVGKNLTRLFEGNGLTVLPLSLRKDNWKLPSATAIIHLAGVEKDTGSPSNQDDYFQVNSYLTEKVFQEFLASEIQDFIFVSSIKAVADSAHHVVTEEEKPNPISLYGKSKLLAEELISKYQLPANKRLIIIRPCLIHGPEDTGNLQLLYKIAQKGLPFPLGGFQNQRSFLSIDNLSFLLLEILKNSNVRSGIYNFADDQPISTNKLMELMYLSLSKKPRILMIPSTPILFISNMFARLGVHSIHEKLHKLTDSFVVSNSKIKKELGIDVLPLSAEEGLMKTIESFKK